MLPWKIAILERWVVWLGPLAFNCWHDGLLMSNCSLASLMFLHRKPALQIDSDMCSASWCAWWFKGIHLWPLLFPKKNIWMFPRFVLLELHHFVWGSRRCYTRVLGFYRFYRCTCHGSDEERAKCPGFVLLAQGEAATVVGKLGANVPGSIGVRSQGKLGDPTDNGMIWYNKI